MNNLSMLERFGWGLVGIVLFFVADLGGLIAWTAAAAGLLFLVVRRVPSPWQEWAQSVPADLIDQGFEWGLMAGSALVAVSFTRLIVEGLYERRKQSMQEAA